jgi:TonB-linked SusC/RagA family outer membrane protein
MHVHKHWKPLVWLGAMVAIVCTTVSPLAGQATGTIRGTVVEAGSLRPLSGVQVSVLGTGKGALTNASGEYLLVGIPTGSQRIETQMIGYSNAEQTVSVTAEQMASADFELSQAAVALDEIVVTGTAGAVSKRTLGNAVTTVNAAEVVDKVSNNTVSELLQAKAPGVTMMSSGGTVGTSGSLRIRGVNSLSAGNEPVIYVDGVRVYSGFSGNFSNTWHPSGVNILGGQNSSALDQINPEDIESIEVIKGPAAATLYGADAAAGVIQIITKRGKTGQQELEWNAKVQTGQTDWTVDPIRNYTTCTAERIAERLDEDDPNSPFAWSGCQGLEAGTVIDYAGLADNPFGLRQGAVRNYQLSVRGGGDGYSFYIAGDRDEEEGVFQNNFMDRTSGRANFAFYPSEKVDFSVNMGFNQSHTRFPFNDNGGGGLVISSAMWYPGFNYQAARELSDEEFAGTEGFAWNSPAFANQYDNQLWGERFTLGSTVNYRPFDWFTNRLTVGADVNSREAKKYAAPRSAWSSEGWIFVRRPQDNIYTADYSGTINNALTKDLSSNLSFGAQYLMQQYKDTRSYGYGLASEFNRLVSQAATTYGADSYREEASLGMFLQEQVGWRNRLFLTGAVRMDNSSVFGAEIERIFYPKAMVSYVISEEPFFNVPFLDQLKLRGAWGAAGSAPGPFAAARTYSAIVGTQPNGSGVAGVRLGAFGNPALEPERGEELELGFEAAFLDGRAGVDFTYYNQKMSNAILAVPVPPSSGFTGVQYQNLGEIKNSGIELSLNGTPVQTRPVTWNTRLSFYTNNNELVSFGYERPPIILGFYGSPQRHQPGYALGGFWAKQLVRGEDGEYLRDEAGRLVLEEEESYIGPSTPTREISFSNTVTLFGNLDLYALLDYKGGHYQYNYKDLSRCWGGRCWEVNDPNASELQREMFGDPSIREEKGYGFGYWYYGRQFNFIQKADFVKLRDVSLTYRVPTEWTRRYGTDRVSVTVAGHDLGLWAPDYTGSDPEVNFYGDHEFLRVDSWTAPMLRRITASVNVSF